MKDLYAKCGINCGHCPSYRENLRSADDRQRCSDGWARYLGFRLSPGKLRACDGCQAPDEGNPVRYQNCYVRRCAVQNGLETCALCSAYPCEDVPKVSLAADARDKTATRLGTPIPEENYLTFIEPYEGTKHLDAIRSSLVPADIVQTTTTSVRQRMVDFPDDLPFSSEETSAFGALHTLIAAIESVDGITYAQETVRKKRRRHLLKMLWAFGLSGERKENGRPYLVIDSETYLAQKIGSYYATLKSYFETLDQYGVLCEHVPLVEEGWLTPSRALRKRGWFIKMSFGDDAGGAAALNALQEYTAALGEKHGKQAFRRFSRADFRVLSKAPNG